MKVEELDEDVKLPDADTEAKRPPASAAGEEKDIPHPRPELEEAAAKKKVRLPDPAPAPAPLLAPPKPRFLADMDAGLEMEDKKIEGEHDIQWEIQNWLSAAAPQLKWNDKQSEPDVTWPALEATFPRLSLLARRFLCMLPTSAPSERVWSGFGNLITDQSSTIDSAIATQTMFLRYNHELADKIPL